MSSFSLAGKVALITGATRGLGFEIARHMAAAGATVLINGRTPESVGAAVEQLAEAGNVVPLVGDVNAAEQMHAAVDAAAEAHGGLDILVNNVGMRDRRFLDEFEPDDVRAMMEANLVAPFLLSRHAARHMARRSGGRIINMTSIAAHIARPGDATYITSKGALIAMTKALAAELGPSGITVNAISPGFFATETNRYLVEDKELAAWLSQRTSLGRWGDPSEIAGAAVFLASPAGSYVTGHILAVDGGFLAHY